MSNCPNCGAGIRSGQTICTRCGTSVAQQITETSATQASNVSTQQAQQMPQPQVVYVQQATQQPAIVGRKSRLAAVLLAWFLGAFGIHKFYLGRIGWGFIYLLLFWTFVPAMVAFIEGLVYIFMSDEEFARKYG
jgi:hypothetical protein